MPFRKVDLGMEGGGIHSDGQGTILTTAPVLYDPGRRCFRSIGSHADENAAEEPFHQELSKLLLETLGAEEAIILPGVFDGDDTGGHVDVIAAFAPDGAVLLNDCKDHADPNHWAMLANAKLLRELGRDVVPIPQPEAVFNGGDRLAYSYLNFYPCNGAVLVPTFGQHRDEHAQGILRERFPEHEIIPLDARPFYLGGGGIHCVTQPVPFGRSE